MNTFKAFLATTLLLVATHATAAQPDAAKRAAAPATPVVLSADARGDLAFDIINKWSGEAWKRYKIKPQAWTEKMLPAFAGASAVNLQRAARATSFDAMTAALVGQREASGPTKALGTALADLVYTPLPNGRCRIADSRTISSPLPAVGTRPLQVWGGGSYAFQGGNGSTAGNSQAACGIPNNPVALQLSVTVLPVSPDGFFKVFEYNKAFSEGNTVFYANGQGISNDMLVRACVSCSNEISVYSNGSVNYVIDVVGYYMPPLITKLDCLYAQATGTVASGSSLQLYYNTLTDYGQTATFCLPDSGGKVEYQGPSYCIFSNPTPATITVRAGGTYCAVPGR